MLLAHVHPGGGVSQGHHPLGVEQPVAEGKVDTVAGAVLVPACLGVEGAHDGRVGGDVLHVSPRQLGAEGGGEITSTISSFKVNDTRHYFVVF